MTDISDIMKAAEEVVQAAGSVSSAAQAATHVPGAAHAVAAVQGAVGEAKAKADAMGMGEVFDQVENMIEKKVNLDLDGDGDKGALGAPAAH